MFKIKFKNLFKKEREIFVHERELITMLDIVGDCLDPDTEYVTTRCGWAKDTMKYSIRFYASNKEYREIYIRCLKLELTDRRYHRYVMAFEEEGFA